jgi:hypothetical protein
MQLLSKESTYSAHKLLSSNKKSPAPANAEERDYKRMCVSSLRRKLDERGLDVDGSRDMLIRRLEEGEKERMMTVTAALHPMWITRRLN